MDKLIVWDLECKVDTFKSNSPFGGQRIDGKNAYLLAFNYKYLGESKVYGKGIHETKSFKTKFNNDKDLVEYAYEKLTDPDVIGQITFFGTSFDLPLLNTRLQYHGLPVLPQIPHDDIHKVFKSNKGKLALNSYSLDYLCEFYDLPRKTKVSEEDWVLGRAGNKVALEKIKVYGQNDVEITEQLYHKAKVLNGAKLVIYPQHEDEPCACKGCGGNLQRRGKTYLANGVSFKYRYQCSSCTKWATGSVHKS